MKQLKAMVLLAVLVLVLLLPALGHAKDKVVTTPPISVQVQVDAQGHLSAITPMQKLDEPYASLVRRTLAGWNFYPAKIQGKPVVTTTWLSIEMKAQPRDDGGVDVHVVYLGNGPYQDLRLLFPPNMARLRYEAKIVVQATIGTDGHFSDVRIVQALITDGAYAQEFVDSVLDAMRRAKVRPIIVDGEPVISHISYPITYSLDGMSQSHGIPANLKPARDSAKLISAAKVDAPEDAMVALDSPVSPHGMPSG